MKVETDIVGIECEDQADWCETLLGAGFGGYCYDADVASTSCCARCAQLKTDDASTYT